MRYMTLRRPWRLEGDRRNRERPAALRYIGLVGHLQAENRRSPDDCAYGRWATLSAMLGARIDSVVAPQDYRTLILPVGFALPFLRFRCRRSTHEEDPLTSYSVLLSGPRATIIATWTSELSDHSAKITTIADVDQATDLAYLLPRLSEHVWGAAAWLDTSPAIEAGIAVLIGQLRSSDEHIAPVQVFDASHRHADEWAHGDVKNLLATELPEVLGKLTPSGTPWPTSSPSTRPSERKHCACCPAHGLGSGVGHVAYLADV